MDSMPAAQPSRSLLPVTTAEVLLEPPWLHGLRSPSDGIFAGCKACCCLSQFLDGIKCSHMCCIRSSLTFLLMLVALQCYLTAAGFALMIRTQRCAHAVTARWGAIVYATIHEST
eukprot:6185167-Pleurochrysis_carterae.AAC.1